MSPYVIVAAAVTATALGQVTYKRGVSKPGGGFHWPVLAAAVTFFVLAQAGFYTALTELDVGVVYTATAVTHVLVLGLSKIALGESVSLRHAAAAGLIIAGVGIYGL